MSTLRDEILDVVAAAALLDRPALRPEATPAELGLRSMDLIEVVYALEERFDIRIAYDDPALAGRPLGELCAAVEQLVAERGQR